MALDPKVLMTRAFTTVLGVLIIGGLAIYLPKPYLIAVFIGLAVLGAFEMKTMVEAFGYNLFIFPMLCCILIGFLSFYLPFTIHTVPYLALLFFSVWGLFRSDELKDNMPTLGMNMLAFAYLGSAFFSMSGIFLLENSQGAMIGRQLLLFFFALVWLGDSAAYLLGSTFGKHKIVPKISPKKSWEGTLGNLLGNLLAAVLGKLYFFPFLNTKDVIFISLFFFLFGFMGDLIESTWKRGSGLKDSGSILPGHGGILDRIDSIFLTAPFFFAYFHYMFQMR